MFAKPFLGALDGHIDGVYSMARKPGVLNLIASGAGDGGIIVHDLPTRTKLLRFPAAHKGVVSGLCFTDDGRILSCGVDRLVKLWDAKTTSDGDGLVDDEEARVTRESLATFSGSTAFNAIDHHRSDQLFATGSDVVHIWDENKSSPISTLSFPTSTENITALKFNWSESSVLATTGTDRTFTLYDIRTAKAERRLVLNFRCNALSWNPTFPTRVLLASEDHNLYTFDIRNLSKPTAAYRGHVAAVMCCDWSPTGDEFASGGWDRTLRIWRDQERTSRDIYHGKRMQRIFCTTYTNDSRFILTGSDDGNVRMWKARASERLGVTHGRDESARLYRDKLREQWKHDAEVGRINRRRYLPKSVYRAAQTKTEMIRARQDREGRLRESGAKEGEVKTEISKVVIQEQE
ncbi:rRNA-processing protein sof1 [Tulasnella sp. 424]|nr:rRNA-processing protein sof1 [Tulasnella sp. 424]KAG8975315.1 rRNA-processing protein sof1 [Tulasnella sp. 425]